jgi:hypothetical protein
MPLLALLSQLHADPGQAPTQDLGERSLRRSGQARVLGGSDRSELSLAFALDDLPLEDPWYREQRSRLALELSPESLLVEDDGRAWWDPVVVLRASARVAGGDGPTQGLLGDAEAGLISPRLGADLHLGTPWLEAHGQVQAWVDVLGEQPVDIEMPLLEYGAGLRRGRHRLGFHQEARGLGPGRHGSLMLWDDARPFPAGVGTFHPSTERLGELRAEAGAGWLQRPRQDVQDPGVLWMDLRWAPLPYVELGASRVGLFGGEGRPLPSLGQLVLPTDPHVYDDPDKEEPDQDEIAAIDLRLLAPLPPGAPLDYLEIYWQYGGDDMVMRSIGPVPTPSLAGVANLLGGEVAADAWVLGLEWAQLQDDTFRWYETHRVYHQGFQQDGRWLGHPNGGDQTTWWGHLGYTPLPLALDLSFEHRMRVEVAEHIGQAVIALPTREERWTLALRGSWLRDEGGWWAAGYALSHVQGEGFVEGEDGLRHRAYVELRGLPWVLYGNPAPF